MKQRLTSTPCKPIVYNWIVQIADPEVHHLNDFCNKWSDNREFVGLGTITSDRLWTFGESKIPARDQQPIISDPKPRHVQGIGVNDGSHHRSVDCGVSEERMGIKSAMSLERMVVRFAMRVNK